VSRTTWIFPAVIVIGLSPFYPSLDLYFSGLFYDPATGEFSKNALFREAYNILPFPGIFIALCACGLLALSFWKPKYQQYRKCCLVIILTLSLGAGLLVNEVLKKHWGRPRPVQIEEFGGVQTYRPWYTPDFQNLIASRSFPSGHAAAGWFYLCFIPVGWRLKNRWLIRFGVVTSLFMGGLLSLTRVAQGGHFLSDTLFSGLIMWWTALAFDWLLHRRIS
jgi:lipid A 4'-phosphatase